MAETGRKVWVRFGDYADQVVAFDHDNVADLRKAIKKVFSRKLGGFDASDLIVWYAGAPLDEDVVLLTLGAVAGNSKLNALVVTVSPLEAVPAAVAAAAAPARECPRRAPWSPLSVRARVCAPPSHLRARRVAVAQLVVPASLSLTVVVLVLVAVRRLLAHVVAALHSVADTCGVPVCVCISVVSFAVIWRDTRVSTTCDLGHADRCVLVPPPSSISM